MRAHVRWGMVAQPRPDRSRVHPSHVPDTPEIHGLPGGQEMHPVARVNERARPGTQPHGAGAVPVDHLRDLVVDLPQGALDELHGLVVRDSHATTVDHDEVDPGRPERRDVPHEPIQQPNTLHGRPAVLDDHRLPRKRRDRMIGTRPQAVAPVNRACRDANDRTLTRLNALTGSRGRPMPGPGRQGSAKPKGGLRTPEAGVGWSPRLQSASGRKRDAW